MMMMRKMMITIMVKSIIKGTTLTTDAVVSTELAANSQAVFRPCEFPKKVAVSPLGQSQTSAQNQTKKEEKEGEAAARIRKEEEWNKPKMK
uniref:Putative secreted protein n=1 Tax=Anopheles darlingi TaxID=43151 RepID=A0A2M4DNP7_ANODA